MQHGAGGGGAGARHTPTAVHKHQGLIQGDHDLGHRGHRLPCGGGEDRQGPDPEGVGAAAVVAGRVGSSGQGQAQLPGPVQRRHNPQRAAPGEADHAGGEDPGQLQALLLRLLAQGEGRGRFLAAHVIPVHLSRGI